MDELYEPLRFYKVDKNARQKGALEELKSRINSLELSLEKNNRSIPRMFKSIKNFIRAHDMAKESRLNEYQSEYFSNYKDCMEELTKIVQKRFGKEWCMGGEW